MPSWWRRLSILARRLLDGTYHWADLGHRLPALGRQRPRQLWPCSTYYFGAASFEFSTVAESCSMAVADSSRLLACSPGPARQVLLGLAISAEMPLKRSISSIASPTTARVQLQTPHVAP